MKRNQPTAVAAFGVAKGIAVIIAGCLAYTFRDISPDYDEWK